MRRTKANCGFFLCLLLNLILNIEWSIPAWLLLAAHILWDWSIWLFIVALGLWLGGIIIWMYAIGWAAKVGNEKTPELPNKNPYSHDNSSVEEWQKSVKKK